MNFTEFERKGGVIWCHKEEQHFCGKKSWIWGLHTYYQICSPFSFSLRIFFLFIFFFWNFGDYIINHVWKICNSYFLYWEQFWGLHGNLKQVLKVTLTFALWWTFVFAIFPLIITIAYQIFGKIINFRSGSTNEGYHWAANKECILEHQKYTEVHRRKRQTTYTRNQC